VERSGSFQSLARKLPLELILTETDAPYMGPDRGERNEPANVPRGVAAIAKARGEDEEMVRAAIWDNCRRLFDF
jgi:TatD DNase family protein